MNLLSIAAKVKYNTKKCSAVDTTDSLINREHFVQYPWQSVDLLDSENEEQAKVLQAIRGE